MVSLQRRLASRSTRSARQDADRIRAIEADRLALLADVRAQERRADGMPIGWSGTELSGGYFQGIDPNADLQDRAWLGDTDTPGAAEDMMTDPALAASVQEWLERAKNANAVVKEADPDDAVSRMHAEFVRRNLFELSATRWGAIIQNLTKSVLWGCAMAETVWRWDATDRTPLFELREEPNRLPVWVHADAFDVGHVILADLPARLPTSIQDWLQNEDGSFAGIIQRGPVDDSGRPGNDITLPADSLVLVTHGGNGGNWEGQSRWRAAYFAWKVRQVILRMGVMSIERNGMGVPIAEQTADFLQLDDSKAKAAWDEIKYYMKRYRAGNQAWLATPLGIKLRVEEADLKSAGAILDLYNALAADIHILGNTQHLIQGSQDVGTYGLREGQASEFRATLNPTLDDIADALNRHVVRPLIDKNWPGVTQYPTLSFDDQEHGSTKEDLERYQIAVTAGMPTQPEDWEQFREQNNWPKLTEDALAGFNHIDSDEDDPAPEPAPEPEGDDDPEPSAETLAEGGCRCGCGGDRLASLFADAMQPGPLDAVSATTPPGERIRLLAETTFDGRSSRVAREDAVKRTAEGAHRVIGRITAAHLEKIRPALEAGDAKAVVQAPLAGKVPLAQYLRTQYQDVRELGKSEVKRETKRQKADPEFEVELDAALAEWFESTSITALFQENPSGVENGVDEVVRSKPSILERRRLAALTTAESLIAGINKTINDFVQQNPPDRWDEDAMLARVEGVITPRTMAKDISQDVQTSYNLGRAEESRAVEAGVAVYTVQPEIGINGPHEVCSECVATATSADNPAVVGTAAEEALMVPNPACLSTLGGTNNCWCAIIYLQTPSLDEARRVAGLA